MSSRLIHSMVYPIQWSQVSLGHQRHTQIDVGTTAIRYVEAVNYFDTKITRIYKFQQKKEQMEKTPGWDRIDSSSRPCNNRRRRAQLKAILWLSSSLFALCLLTPSNHRVGLAKLDIILWIVGSSFSLLSPCDVRAGLAYDNRIGIGGGVTLLVLGPDDSAAWRTYLDVIGVGFVAVALAPRDYRRGLADINRVGWVGDGLEEQR